jgi:hypothetical protein
VKRVHTSSTVRKRNLGRAGRALALNGALASLVLVAACGTATPSATPGSPGPTQPPTPTIAPSPSTSAVASPAPTIGGFVFAAADIVGYYQTLGYTCTAEQPSATADGFAVRTCSLLDPAGRTRVVGVVTDPAGLVANGFATVAGTSSETVLDPTVALEPLAAFLGAMLGQEQGAALVPWLAAHLGDSYAQTTAGPITVATYTDAANVHSKLYLELANDEYLSAPGVSAAPTASGATAAP